MSKILSICIPTYNRANCLEECLNSIAKSIAGFEDDVEIVISDNASTDTTQKVVEKFCGTLSVIRYFRNVENIGGERNFRLVASLAEAEYILVFGDDDKMAAAAIEIILDKIKKGVDLLVLNYSIWDKNFSHCIKSHAFSMRDKTYHHKNLIMSDQGLNIGYISTVVVKKDLFFVLSAAEYEKYVPFGFPFAYAVYAGMKENCEAVYVSEPIVLNRAGNSGNYDWYKFFVTGSSLIFDSLLSIGYSKDAVDKAKKKVIKQYVILDLLVKKRDGKKMTGLLELMYPFYKSYVLYWLVIVPVCFLPASLVWSSWWVLKKIKGIKKTLILMLAKA